MKNIGIITHYDVHNHGALLQLTALINVLKEKNIRAKALQFDKNYDFMGHKLKAKYEGSIKALGIYLKYFQEKGFGCTKYNYGKRKTLNSYKVTKDIIGDYYSESPTLDAVIIGSDEVFALHTGPTPVFFGHCLPTENVISYAGSFGPTTIGDVDRLHCRQLIKSGLENMKAVTVRDQNSADVVKNLIGIDPMIVVDPVLLYGYKKEIEQLNRPLSQKYLLVYAYDNRMNDPEEVNAIKRYARAKGLKTLSPGFFHKWCDICVDVDPINLLAYFKYADEVVTDTFHGSVMSIITNAQFAVKTRESNHFKLKNLLAEYGLTDRIFISWNQLSNVFDQEIDYNIVNREVENRRAASMNKLDEMLKICGI